MQEVTVSQGTTQPGRGDAALPPPIQEGFWIWNINGKSGLLKSDGAAASTTVPPSSYQTLYWLYWLYWLLDGRQSHTSLFLVFMLS